MRSEPPECCPSRAAHAHIGRPGRRLAVSLPHEVQWRAGPGRRSADANAGAGSAAFPPTMRALTGVRGAGETTSPLPDSSFVGGGARRGESLGMSRGVTNGAVGRALLIGWGAADCPDGGCDRACWYCCNSCGKCRVMMLATSSPLSSAINIPLPVNGSMKEAASPIVSSPSTGVGEWRPKPSSETASQLESRTASRSVCEAR